MMAGKSRFITTALEGRPSRRPARVGDAIKNEIATLLIFKINDPRLQNISITEVSMTADLRQARVKFSCDDGEQKNVIKGLESAKGFIRKHIGSALSMRYVPELIFKRDLSLLRQLEMDKLFQEIKSEDE